MGNKKVNYMVGSLSWRSQIVHLCCHSYKWEKINLEYSMYDFLSSCTFDLAHWKGRENVIADALSRLPLPPTEDDHDKCRLIEEGDLEVCMIESSSGKPRKSLPLQSIVPRSRQVCYFEPAMPPATDEVAETTWNELQDSLSSRTGTVVGFLM